MEFFSAFKWSCSSMGRLRTYNDSSLEGAIQNIFPLFTLIAFNSVFCDTQWVGLLTYCSCRESIDPMGNSQPVPLSTEPSKITDLVI
ncbi:hypothetical protein AHF37_10841 [Paragonimus kellicotti]|nr:hypothetical protein AHF37_10841 [Paragonimus kellicotti]